MLLAMPSGTQPGDLLNPTIMKVNGVSVLHIKWKWPAIILDPIRMFWPSRFNGPLGVGHSKVVTLVKTMDFVWGSNKFCTLTMTSKLPSQEDYKRGNNGDVSQGRCGGGAPYCGPRGARFN